MDGKNHYLSAGEKKKFKILCSQATKTGLESTGKVLKLNKE